MFNPGSWCLPNPAPFVQSCCTPGFNCLRDNGSFVGYSCRQVSNANLTYGFEGTYGKCEAKVTPGAQCGGGGGACKLYNQCANTGPWNGFCCPDGFTCQPSSASYRIWTCQADVTDQAPAGGDNEEALQYPPRTLPGDACTCRVDSEGRRIPTACPSPWDHKAGKKQVPTPVKIGAKGRFVSSKTGEDVVIHGVNWYGWNVGQYNFDGLWAFCDDNYTASEPPCQQDGDIPPHSPEPAIGQEGIDKIGGIKFWGKRTMTNDFATVVYRLKLLGFNAVRMPFSFSDLNKDIPNPSTGETEFFPCMHDSDAYVAFKKTMDPQLQELVAKQGGQFDYPTYSGPQHPPPADPKSPQCSLPWEAPFSPNYRGGEGSLKLTQCNWYLPQGPNVPAIQRFLWQLQYIVSQGMYVILTFSSGRDPEPNVASPALLTKNWRALWNTLKDLPEYESLIKGRVFADVANEPSRWGCQWDKPCRPEGAEAASCAPGVWLYAAAASGIHAVDPDAPVLLQGMGQDVLRGKYQSCSSGSFPGLKWGDGFITNGPTVARYNLSDPSGMFAYDNFRKVGPIYLTKTALPNQVALAPHLYPRSVTGVAEDTEDQDDEITWKWDLSWGYKSLGLDKTSSWEPLRDIGLIIGEFGAQDSGDNGIINTDTTAYSERDRRWLKLLGGYLNKLSWQNGPASWVWWSWNANSGDTKGLVGPLTTWREVQWTKVRLLVREFGLVPWYCVYVSGEFCAAVKW